LACAKSLAATVWTFGGVFGLWRSLPAMLAGLRCVAIVFLLRKKRFTSHLYYAKPMGGVRVSDFELFDGDWLSRNRKGCHGMERFFFIP
jgi:hypothetical protein